MKSMYSDATHAVAKDAYYPELSPLQAELNAIGATASMYLFATELIFVVIVVGGVGMAIGISDQNVPMAHLSQGISTAALTWSLVHIYGRLLRAVPRSRCPSGRFCGAGRMTWCGSTGRCAATTRACSSSSSAWPSATPA